MPIKKKVKLSSRGYMKPTPKNLRKLGDGLLAVGALVTGASIGNSDVIAYISLAVSVIGKFLTNFFEETN